MKIGLDYHGVITSNPKLFSELSKLLCSAGHEVHIITGSRITPILKDSLKEYSISYTHLFSISDYHHGIGTPMRGYDRNEPWIDEYTWDRTKALYCDANGIDLHIDDSEIYARYFTTPFALFK